MSDRLQGKSIVRGVEKEMQEWGRGGDQVLSYARCPRTQEPIGFTEYGRCSVNARSLENTWSPPFITGEGEN